MNRHPAERGERLAGSSCPTPLISEGALAALRAGALDGGPCAHLVVDDFLRPEIAARALDEIERFDGRWRHRRHHGQSKRVFTDYANMPDAVREIVTALHSDEFVSRMEVVGGWHGLIPDPDLEGGGLCEMRPGDFMRPHLDSLAHITRPRWRRRHALFVFLNPGWKEEYGGSLTLWSGSEAGSTVRISPVFNRCVLFGDPSGVYHGVPDVIRCPPGAARRSIAVYYYTEETDTLPLRPTTYGTPGNDEGPPGIFSVNQFMVWLYFALRRLRGPSA